MSKGLLVPAKEGILLTLTFKVSRSAVVRGASSGDKVLLVGGPVQVQTQNALLTHLR